MVVGADAKVSGFLSIGEFMGVFKNNVLVPRVLSFWSIQEAYNFICTIAVPVGSVGTFQRITLF